MKRTHAFQVIIEQDEAGCFVAECLALKACYTQGATFEEAIRNIKDVIALCLADLKAKGREIPRQLSGDHRGQADRGRGVSDTGPGLLHKILRDIEVEPQQLERWLSG